MVTTDGRLVLLDFGVVGEYSLEAAISVRERRDRSSERPRTWRPNRLRSTPRRRPPTGTPSASFCSKRSRGACRSKARRAICSSRSNGRWPRRRPRSSRVSRRTSSSFAWTSCDLDPRRPTQGRRSAPSPRGREHTRRCPCRVEAPFVGTPRAARCPARGVRREPHEGRADRRDAARPIGDGKERSRARGSSALWRRCPTCSCSRGAATNAKTVPFKAVDQVVDELSRWLSRLHEEDAYDLLPPGIHALTRLFPVLRNVRAGGRGRPDPAERRADPLEVRRRAFAALKDLLDAITQHRSLVIHVDDVQWGDADSVQLLESLLSAPAPRPLLLVCDHRSEVAAVERCSGGASDACASGCRGCATSAISRWSSSTSSEARELADGLLERSDGLDALTPWPREAHGNPLFVAELARWANERREVARGAVALEQVILARVADLSEEARALLETISLARGPIATSRRRARRWTQEPGRRTAAIALRAARLVTTRGLRRRRRPRDLARSDPRDGRGEPRRTHAARATPRACASDRGLGSSRRRVRLRALLRRGR